MGDVGFLAGKEVVQTNDIMTLADEAIAKMRAQKAGSARDQNAF